MLTVGKIIRLYPHMVGQAVSFLVAHNYIQSDSVSKSGYVPTPAGNTLLQKVVRGPVKTDAEKRMLFFAVKHGLIMEDEEN
jgi:hypothetical protein